MLLKILDLVFVVSINFFLVQSLVCFCFKTLNVFYIYIHPNKSEGGWVIFDVDGCMQPFTVFI